MHPENTFPTPLSNGKRNMTVLTVNLLMNWSSVWIIRKRETVNFGLLSNGKKYDLTDSYSFDYELIRILFGL